MTTANLRPSTTFALQPAATRDPPCRSSWSVGARVAATQKPCDVPVTPDSIDRMSDAVVTLLAGLGGALIGGSAAMGAQWQANRHAREEDRRRERVDLVARYWEATDRLWQTSMSVGYLIEDMQSERQAGHTDRVRELEPQRLARLADRSSADSECGFLLAQMRLLGLSLVEEATTLRKASRYPRVQHDTAATAAHTAALEAYESAASRMLDST